MRGGNKHEYEFSAPVCVQCVGQWRPGSADMEKGVRICPILLPLLFVTFPLPTDGSPL